MNAILKWTVAVAFLGIIVAGCQSESAPMSTASSPKDVASSGDDHGSDDSEASDVKSAMANLSNEDRSVAESQKFCAVMETNLLGSMGTPLKLVVNGEPVFVCCAGCKSKAMKNPEETLARVAKLKADNAATATK